MANPASRHVLDRFGIAWPIIQAPMAGVSSPAMAAAVSQAGGLGSIGVGAVDAAAARAMIRAVRERTSRPFNVNVFAHRPAQANPAREAAWIARLRPEFARFAAVPPAHLREIYQSFLTDTAMLATLVEERPAVVSFHFGLPDAARLGALRDAGIMLVASVTNAAEAEAARRAGVDAIVAQGYEAGGHRGTFDPDAPDEALSTVDLVRRILRQTDLPVIAAGGIMTGAEAGAALRIGAAAVQLGTAFVATTESLANLGYRAALFSDAAHHTVMTRVISGRPARSLASRFTALGADLADRDVPDYPIAYDLGKALHAAALEHQDHGYGAYWAGTGAPRARAMGAADLVRTLVDEIGQ
ncbi:nitronate monooxygenase family protein [Novosphingobium sp. FSW06-99]|uniref:NAD(P)H-dependent flavin oxidoreductase n=1 Tax=Novosphingobium sp. FSW06-99 TaxID=1739113 RepID=UPI00076C9A18|nr:nitronate monooxygenase [Novosphingobium sp. FSW06-99]KUR78259.1 2-nitropropane dioxygenase [Novosphingobium sp. FSW06-99]